MRRQKPHGFHEVNSLDVNPVLGMLSAQDFEIAQSRTKLFSAWRHHDDFVQEREAAWFGFATAGARAELQTVSYAAFDLWSRLTGAPSDIVGFDAFATSWRLRSQRPKSPVKGSLCNAPEVANWVEGGHGFRVSVFREHFQAWRKAMARLSAITGTYSTIDDYAALVVECCIDSPLAQAER